MSKSYCYFVSYAHERGFGSIEVEFTKPIHTSTDIKLLREYIECQKKLGPIVILNYISLKSID